MTKFEILDQLVEEGNGYLQTSKVVEAGVAKKTLASFVSARGMSRVAHGIYVTEDAWEDKYYLLHLRNSKMIFSHESALYLHVLMDREPKRIIVTVPQNYNASHITSKGIKVVHSKAEWYDVGISKIATKFGNTVVVYDRERTICDIIRSKKYMDIQTYQTAIKEYMSESDKRLGNLIRYARIFGIENEVRTYTEVML